MKSADIAIVKTTANRIESVPRGKARRLVRGFITSYCRSAMRLKVMAALRPPTIAATIHVVCQAVGNPFRANNAPINANGNAKTVCSNRIMSSVVRNLFIVGG